MKTFRILFAAFFLICGSAVQGQTADEILDNYFENIGGKDNFKGLKGVKMMAKVNQGGMEIPLEIIQLADGRQMTLINFQGKEIKQGVFDGETLWSHNFMTMQPEKSDAETTANFKLSTNDFPDAFLDYKEKGYTVELMGEETVEGTPAYKLKLVKEPLTIDGQQEEDVSYYYFDKDSFVPIVVENEIRQGPAKGQVSSVAMSDYQEVDGLYFPFTMVQGVKGQPGQPIVIESIQLNPEVAEGAFDFPETIEVDKN